MTTKDKQPERETEDLPSPTCAKMVAILELLGRHPEGGFVDGCGAAGGDHAESGVPHFEDLGGARLRQPAGGRQQGTAETDYCLKAAISPYCQPLGPTPFCRSSTAGVLGRLQ
jgi:hypothetical protein